MLFELYLGIFQGFSLGNKAEGQTDSFGVEHACRRGQERSLHIFCKTRSKGRVFLSSKCIEEESILINRASLLVVCLDFGHGNHMESWSVILKCVAADPCRLRMTGLVCTRYMQTTCCPLYQITSPSWIKEIWTFNALIPRSQALSKVKEQVAGCFQGAYSTKCLDQVSSGEHVITIYQIKESHTHSRNA